MFIQNLTPSKKAVLAVFLILTGWNAHSSGDQSIISGIVTVEDTREVLPGASIVVEALNIGVASDYNGQFSIQNVQGGKHTLVISCIGYESQRKVIDILDGKTLHLSIALKSDITTLEGIIIRRISLTGGENSIRDIPGSAHYIKSQTLEKFNYQDINRVLSSIPGINLQEEDGFGLRPNIGFRGTGSERSSKITIMEDGILMAPAPYAAPSAYYFPNTQRMKGIEIRKGSSQIKYGPYTTGGAINLVSSPIPKDLLLSTQIMAGNYGYQNIYAQVGQTFGRVGVFAEGLNTRSSGFKNLDNGGKTGFVINDYTIKAKYEAKPGATVYQGLQFKIGYATEESRETYLGLTREDFGVDPYRRYAGSQKDLMTNEHRQMHLRHVIQPLKWLDITTTLYANDFQRNWYKLDRVKGTEDGSAIDIASIMENPDVYDTEYQTLKGNSSEVEDALFVKANNRSYYSRGIESILGMHFDHSVAESDLEIGLRFHKDQEDRYQWVDAYGMTDSVMMMTKKGTPGTESNRLETASAFAGFMQYIFTYGNFRFTPGIRYENIGQKREDFGKQDPGRNGTSLNTKKNNMDVWIPGVGLEYQITETLAGFIGIHKGFTPAGSQEGTIPEISLNNEIGLRFSSNALNVQGVFFYNSYQNLLGADNASSGGSGTGDLFNGGEAKTTGVEFETYYNFLRQASGGMKLPVGIAYTWTNARFMSDFDSEFEPWGSVSKGDKLPYVPEQQVSLNISLENQKFNLNFNSRYNGAMRIAAGQGLLTDLNSIKGFFVFDVSANVNVGKHIIFQGVLINAANNQYAVSSRPAGMRPGMPRAFRLGIKAHL